MRVGTHRTGIFGIRWVFFCFCAWLISGCATTQTTILPNPDDAAPDYSGIILEDDGIVLTDAERRALLSQGELDRGLSREDLLEVQKYFKFYVHGNRRTIELNLLRSRPYLAYARKVFREKGMPEELACLAYVESGYNPVAVSRSKAMGMWQFMSATGRQYDLTQDWWMDERLDPYKATRAAAEYLAELYDMFHDWHLAIASYNAGPGKISRALEGTGESEFFELCRSNDMLDEKRQLKPETMQYVPRFLAMCKIMRNIDTLGFSPAEPRPEDLVKVPARELRAKPNTDLAAFAGALNMSWAEFSAYNPAFKRYITPPDRHVSVYVPYHVEARADKLLRDGKLSGKGWATYTIVRNDTLSKISSRTGVPVSILRQANPRCEPLQIGKKLRIPSMSGNGEYMIASASSKKASSGSSSSSSKASQGKRSSGSSRAAAVAAAPKKSSQTAAPSKKSSRSATVAAASKKSSSTSAKSSGSGKSGGRSHEVRSGDTLASIAREYGVTLTAMREANTQLEDPHKLKVGQKLNVPAAPKKDIMYTVRSGDTLWSISRRFNTSPGEIRSPNNLTSNTLRPGDALRVAVN